jgi:L-methionine (R)-S-oxide reductase
MFDFQIATDDPQIFYAELADAAAALVAGESDAIANMANISALLWQAVPNLNWAGFYRVTTSAAGARELVLGPFQGKAACIRIAEGKGVCGTALSTGETQLVADVHAFPGHIACDAASESELVIPIFKKGAVVAVLDLDSPTAGRFTEADKQGFEALLARIEYSLSS